ncbi:MAG: hypothetical protein NTY64_14485, partial [Deltaproteobacteria bacterium]|nr:hypothetical protein [Deltaproteobacteria bacterium]
CNFLGEVVGMDCNPDRADHFNQSFHPLALIDQGYRRVRDQLKKELAGVEELKTKRSRSNKIKTK